MPVVAVGLLLGLLLLLLHDRLPGAGGALVRIVFRFTLGTTPAGSTLAQLLNSAGAWAWSALQAL